jgi:hypothetical protein
LAVPNIVPLVEPTAAQIWTWTETLYGAISLAQVFDLYQQTLCFSLSASRPLLPQLEALDALYVCLAQQHNVVIPEYVHTITLLTSLPPSWGPEILHTVMSDGNILLITMVLVRQTITRYWDAQQA